MKVLVFDTETTNILPRDIPLMRQYLHHYPHIVQLSFMMYDTELYQIISCKDYVIRIPDNVEIPPESTNVHGINREIVNKKGVEIKIALEDFKKHYKSCDVLIAHNLKFDTTMVTVDAMRIRMGKIINTIDPKKTHYCTMNNSIELCNIIINKNGKTYKKFPKQIELHGRLFEEKVNEEKLHDSSMDILLCLRCYMYMVHENDIVDDDKVYNKYYKTLFIED